MSKVVGSALNLIGQTPLIELKTCSVGGGRLFAKAELLQPGGSVKDRAARTIIERAYALGQLVQGTPVVEMTSGNMGAGLAVVCGILGNPFTAVMSEGNSPARARMLRGLGAEVVLVPQVDGVPAQVTGRDIGRAAEVAQSLASSRNAFYVDQFNNEGSMIAHEQGTAPEIWEALEGRITAFVAAVGSAGTFVGTSRGLKQRDPRIRCYAVEPEGAEVLAGRTVTKAQHMLQGIGYGSIPPRWDAALADGFLAVGDDEAIRYREILAHREGLFVGFSAAANVCAAVRLMERGELGVSPTVVTVLCDTGLKYAD